MTDGFFEGDFEANQAMQIAQLLQSHGYQPVQPEEGVFLKSTSGQQGLLALINAKQFPQRTDRKVTVALSFGIARPDVNVHIEQWRPDFVNGFVRDPWSPTVVGHSGTGPFAKRQYSAFEPFTSFRSELDQAIVAQGAWTELQHFEELLYSDEVNQFSVVWDRIVNDALSGRDDRSHAEYKRLRDGAPEAAEDWQRMFEHFNVRYTEFRTKHPKGIR